MNARFREVVSEVLGLSPAQITPDLRRTDTDLWDSINHLRLITVLETEFGASFTMDEIAQAQTPADLERVIESRGCAVRET